MSSPDQPQAGAAWLWPGHPDEKTKSETISKILALYDEGIPFFTKAAIRDVYQQLKAAGPERRMISVTGVDGRVVKCRVEVGTSYDSDDPDIEHVLEGPFISYRSIQSLSYFSDWATDGDLERAFCSLRIPHRSVPRNKSTKEIINRFPTHPLEAVESAFQTYSEQWEASDPCKHFQSTLLSVLTTRKPDTISKIIGFGCGPMSCWPEEWSGRRSAFQHRLLLTVRNTLRDTTWCPDEVRCYAQDPAYTDVDKSVITKAGIAILENPEAFLELDDSTVVVSCSPDVPVRQLVSELARPVIMIWGRVTGDIDEYNAIPQPTNDGCTDPESPRLTRMIKDFYDAYEFPDDREHFGDIAIYVRRADVSQN